MITGTKRLLYSMLTESTGTHFLDSGGESNRGWQRNQKRTIEDFENELAVEADSGINSYSVSVFHYLGEILSLDPITKEFNKKFKVMKDWESDIYGVSTKAKEWLENHGFEFGESVNTYNGEETLSQTIQYTPVNLGDRKYLLVQIHNGCDVRGGYTDAKLFRWEDTQGFGTDWAFIMGSPNVYGFADGKEVSNSYDGISLTYDDGYKEVEQDKVKDIRLSLGV